MLTQPLIATTGSDTRARPRPTRGCLMKGVSFALATLLTGLAAATPATAQGIPVATTTLDVTATVTGGCTIEADPLDFGTINPTIEINYQAEAFISVNCTFPTGLFINLDGGTAGSDGNNRHLSNQGLWVIYFNLFADPARSVELPPNALLSVTVDAGTPLNLPVFGTIPAGQIAPAVGAYTSTLTATVSF